MKPPVVEQRLSAVDAAFLYLERKEIPLHIACISIFDDTIPFEEFVASIDSKLHLVPRYQQVVVSPPLHIGHPVWEYDRHFDIRRHIFDAVLDPPGGDAELEALAGSILSRCMDRLKPLWDIHVVRGLSSGRGALVVRIHHSLADGVSGAALLNVMLDPTPEGSRPIRKPHLKPPPAAAPSLADALREAAYSALQNLIAAEAGILGFAQSLFSERMQAGLEGLTGLLPELATPVERLPFNKQCGGERRVCWAEFDFADVQAIRAAAGGTVNDVVLTALTRALARYVEMHGEKVGTRMVRIVCPVSLRQAEQRDKLGNQISFRPVNLPLHVSDPLQHLAAIARRTAIMKSVGAAEIVRLAASCLGMAPPPVQALFWQMIPLIPLPTPLLNMICTNVPGSPVPLYAAGRRMLAMYPYVPTGYELGIGCAVQSYDGKLFCGLTADAGAAPDAARLRDFIQDAFEELCRAAGLRKKAKLRTPRASRSQKERTPEPAAAPQPAVMAGAASSGPARPSPVSVIGDAA